MLKKGFALGRDSNFKDLWVNGSIINKNNEKQVVIENDNNNKWPMGDSALIRWTHGSVGSPPLKIKDFVKSSV